MEFALPKALSDLINTGVWPATHQQQISQNSRPLVSEERVRAFAPEHDRIDFYEPPFGTIADEALYGNSEFWHEFGSLAQIDPSHLLMIADFGPGSDAPIVLQYDKNNSNPKVLRLRWVPGKPQTTWEFVADSFDTFVKMVGLETSSA